MTSAISLPASPNNLRNSVNFGCKVDSPPPVISIAGIPASTICLGKSSTISSGILESLVGLPIGLFSLWDLPTPSINSNIPALYPSSFL